MRHTLSHKHAHTMPIPLRSFGFCMYTNVRTQTLLWVRWYEKSTFSISTAVEESLLSKLMITCCIVVFQGEASMPLSNAEEKWAETTELEASATTPSDSYLRHQGGRVSVHYGACWNASSCLSKVDGKLQSMETTLSWDCRRKSVVVTCLPTLGDLEEFFFFWSCHHL